MPSLPSPGPVIRVREKWATEAPNYVFTRRFLGYSGGPPTGANLAALAAAINANMVTYLKALLSSAFALVEIECVDLSSSSGAGGMDLAVQAGSRGGTAPLAQTPAHFHWDIARRYRGGKPGAYYPFFDQGDYLNVYQWNAAAVSTAASDLASYITAQNGATFGATTIDEPVSISYYEGFTVVTNPVTGRARNVPKLRATPIVDIVLGVTGDERISSQRRRRGPAI